MREGDQTTWTTTGRASEVVRSAAFNTLALALAFAGVGDISRATDAIPGNGELTRTDKSKFTLFNPTPKEYLRELAPDRPDKTEGPYTVDAGHFQIELDLATYTYDRERANGVRRRVDAWAIAPCNFKVGLWNQADFQVVIETWNEVSTRERSAGVRLKEHSSGFGAVTTRLKYNFWGNDGGPTALAVMPFLTLPTSQEELRSNSIEGGAFLPLAVELPGGFGMGSMTGLALRRDETGNDYHVESVNSITFGRDIVGQLAGYLEFFSSVSAERGSAWVGTFDLGLTYGLSENVQLDAGVNIGLTKSADDLNPFLGLSCRF